MLSLCEIPLEARPLVALSIQQLARKLKIPTVQIVVVQITQVTWPDSGLSSPNHGVDFAPAETPGFNILLEAAGSTWSFHTDMTDRVILCSSRPPGDIFIPP